MERGVFVSRTEAEATTLSEVIDRYRREVLPSKRGAASDESRLKTLDAHFGVYKLASITSSAVAKFRDERLKAVGPQSVIHEVNLLNRVLKAATMDWGIGLWWLAHSARAQAHKAAWTRQTCEPRRAGCHPGAYPGNWWCTTRSR